MTNELVIIGSVLGVHGVKGWLKIYSYTRPLENIVQYRQWRLLVGEHATKGNEKSPLFDNEIDVEVSDFRLSGNKILVKLVQLGDRNSAQTLVGRDIAVRANELPKLEDEYYWRDLVGLTVEDTQGEELGEVVEIMETGANDVLLLKNTEGKSHAIPWLEDVVLSVDLSKSLIVVDWEPLI